MEKLMNVGTMDNYYEQIVQKKFNSKMLATLIMSMVGIVVAIFLSIYLSIYFNWLVPVSLLLLGIGIWLIWFLIKNSGVEYEYTFVLGELRIERIKRQRRFAAAAHTRYHNQFILRDIYRYILQVVRPSSSNMDIIFSYNALYSTINRSTN